MYAWRDNTPKTVAQDWAEYEAMNERANAEYGRVLTEGMSRLIFMTDASIALIKQRRRERWHTVEKWQASERLSGDESKRAGRAREKGQPNG